MKLRRIAISLYVPEFFYPLLRALKRDLFPSPPPSINLAGDRQIEWSFLNAEMPCGPGKALDFGCGDGYMSLSAAQNGFHVTAVDLEPQSFFWRHPGVEFVQGDLLKIALPRNAFDVIINCSAVEHVGIAGRYGITTQQNDGDIEVMGRLAELLKPSGVLLMTAPCGRDAVMAPWHRVYGAERLPKLLAPYRVLREAFWIKDAENRWVPCHRDAALNFQARSNPKDMSDCAYALGCFVMRETGNAASAVPGGTK